MIDLEDGLEERIVTDNSASQVISVAVGPDIIVWPDTRNDAEYPNLPASATNWDLYMYDLTEGTEMQLTNLPGRESCPRVFDNKIYYMMADDSGVKSVFEVTLRP